jgi:glucose/arabinose dehydrogenase
LREALTGLQLGQRNDAPARGPRQAAQRGFSQPLPLWKRFFLERRLLRMGLFVAFAGAVAIGVPVNALFMQDRPHPAPLFHVAAPRLDPARHNHASASGDVAPNAAPLPPARPSTLAAAKGEGASAEAGKAAEKPADQIAVLLAGGANKVEPKPLDQIAALLKGGVAKAEPKPTTKSALAKDNGAKQGGRTVIFAQRALAKLGYALHEDGVFGGTTRQAIEKFERANGMPVKGELTPKILRLLSRRSGVAMR